jgi:SAM-dependent methyltransferase
MAEMSEPQASEFRSLLRQGAGARDIHGIADSVGFAACTAASDAFVARELARVESHRRGSCALLEAVVGPSARILDVGCSTGGGTVALALSPVLRAERVVGVDPEPLSLLAAEARARGYGLAPSRVSFVATRPGAPLPFERDEFDLVTCVSVLEFVPTSEQRRHLIEEMKRVARPGAHLYLATPSPFRARELHSRRWLGDLRRSAGYPWALTPSALAALVDDCERVQLEGWLAARVLARVGLRRPRLPSALATALVWAHRWQRVLVRKPGHPGPIIA